MKKLKGDPTDYYIVDTWYDLDIAMLIEFVNFLTPNGLPPHKLTLQEGAIVYVVRNLNANIGLVNGQRFKIVKLY